VRIRVFGGFAVEQDGAPVEVTGVGQRALLFRLALDPGTVVGYHALAEDLWGLDAPENPRAALQSLVSRLRPQLPVGTIVSEPGGYRLAVSRATVDVVAFQDLVATRDPARAAKALELWTGEPWTPGDGYGWLLRDLAADRAAAERLAAAPLEPSPIPAPLTALIGREAELASVAGQFERARLVTVLGPGGAGKTRLAVEAARGDRRAVLVELAPVGPDELWQAILGAAGRELTTVEGERQPATARDRIVAALGTGERLLVLDNCEHLIDAAARVAVDLLGALPRLRILATSREPLGVPGEAFVPLGPLGPEAAEALFAERVLAARGRPIQEDERESAARARARLDGLPLALELAAAKARTMEIEEIASGLDDRFGLLAGGLRTVLPRHQTLRALVDWSWTLLDEGERALLAAISAYPAGVAVGDAADVAAAHGGRRADVDALVDKSLLYRAEGRYRALETIREYGLERLAESGRLEEQRVVQARRLGAAARLRDAQLRTGRIHEALAWFDGEDDNVVSALRFAIGMGRGEEAVRLAAANAWYWIVRDRNEDAASWLTAVWPFAKDREDEEALLVRAVQLIASAIAGAPTDATPREIEGAAIGRVSAELATIAASAAGSRNDLLQVLPPVVAAFAAAFESGTWPVGVDLPDEAPEGMGDWARGMLSVVRASIAQNSGDVPGLGRASEEALAAFGRTGDSWGLALSMQMRSEWLALAGRDEEALAMADASTEAMRDITSRADLQQQQGLAVILLRRLGRIDEALARADGLVAEAREAGSSRALGLALITRGLLAVDLGDRVATQAVVAELGSFEAMWPGAPPQMVALHRMLLARVALLDGDAAEAERLVREAAEAATESRDHPVLAMVAVAAGLVAVESGRTAEGARALALAERLRGAPDPRDPAEAALRAVVDAARPALESGTGHADRGGAIEELAQILRR